MITYTQYLKAHIDWVSGTIYTAWKRELADRMAGEWQANYANVLVAYYKLVTKKNLEYLNRNIMYHRLYLGSEWTKVMYLTMRYDDVADANGFVKKEWVGSYSDVA